MGNLKKKRLNRGYKEVSEKVMRNPKFFRSCYNCYYFYQSREDREELCQNPDVLEYDMVIEEDRFYCIKWRPVGR